MNTRHTPSLELCQEFDRLCKEKNITIPETEFYWKVGKASGHANLTTDKPDLENWTKTDNGFDWYHAPLVSELGELLPQRIAKNKGQQVWALQCFKKMHNGKEEWFTRYENVEGTGFLNMQDPTEANARMKCLNYLIAEGIITKL